MNRKQNPLKTSTSRRVLVTTLLALLSITMVTYTSCHKDVHVQSTYLEYDNNTFTPINITVDNQTKVIPVGGSITYTGFGGDQINGTATTAGSTSTGGIVGVPINWNFNTPFPYANTDVQELNVTSDFFFLQIVNNSPETITTVYVNYGLQSQTVDNVTIPNDGHLYAIGYYRAYTNSTARFESANSFWTFNSLALPFTSNQTITLTAN